MSTRPSSFTQHAAIVLNVNSLHCRYNLKNIEISKGKTLGKQGFLNNLESSVLDAVMLVSKKRKIDDDDDYSQQLRKEEDDLYGSSTSPMNTMSSVKTLVASTQTYANSDRTLKSFTTIEFEYLDSLTQLGPLGPGCVGATPTPSYDNDGVGDTNGMNDDDDDVEKEKEEEDLLNSVQHSGREMVHPCGMGKTGGLVVLSSPGAGSSTQITDQVRRP